MAEYSAYLPVNTPFLDSVAGIVYHNDDGAMSIPSYKTWLENGAWQNAFAHIYMNSDDILYAYDMRRRAWHSGNTWGNNNLISIEICQSLVASDDQFRKNEQAAFKKGAEILKNHGLYPSRDTIRLHKQLNGTNCPSRSVQLHGGDDATLDYFIKETLKYYEGMEKGLGAPCFIKHSQSLDIGFNFHLDTKEGRFKWLLYDVAKAKWSELVKWTASNWITLSLPKGQYWVQCQLYDLQSNLIDTKTIGTDAGTATRITGTYTGWRDKDILIGCDTNNPNGKLIMKVYDTKTKQWFTQFSGKWATFKPKKGRNYIVQFEVYGTNGNLLDFKSVGV